MTGYPDHPRGGRGTGHDGARFTVPVILACLMLAASGGMQVACATARHGAHVGRHGGRGGARRLPVMTRVPAHWRQHGLASWYGSGRQLGHATASGEMFDPGALTAAHRQLPFGTRILVHSRRTGRSVVVRVNDRGPYHGARIIDLSLEAARQLGMLGMGMTPVDLLPMLDDEEEVAGAPR
ncbi:septal ring lytic transglycosylase RlpA family protein [Komagataeibacter swingsii]|uniref:Endolytic peptidoglycan transglycosylase RlpA n=1 Tax=Komagataeibacter swingsii TaxID=215220 RepID=A0A850NWA5_9PROT|nr:septal ring lytic transglycosylase RlpA family protein [Komagataeibacter swingsii]NVN36695.1 septal ring lytic transglycosylase RlpA family protein [Komagataeibacter swingsii]